MAFFSGASFGRMWLGGSFAFACAVVYAQSPVAPPFAALETPVPPTPMRLIGFGDFDGDGDRDFYGLGAPYVLLNDGDGRFSPLAASAGAAGPATSFSPDDSRYVIADFDGDGRDDLVVTSEATFANSVGTLYLATGGPTAFSASTLPAPTGPLGRVMGGFAGDVDGNGLVDLVVGRALPVSPGSILMFPAPPDVLLNFGGVLTPTGAHGLVGASRLADVDLDGDVDALVGFGGVQSNVGGVFGPVVPAAGGPASPFGLAPSVCDLNGDAYPDLANGDGAQVATFLGGPAGFAAGPSISAPTPGTYPYGPPLPCDADGDGLDELYVAFVNADRLARYDVVGGALVAGPVETAVFDNFPAFVVDLDGDGRGDLVTRSGSTATAVLGTPGRSEYEARFGDGATGLVTVSGALPPRRLSGGLAVADLDGDGDVDLAGTERDGAGTRLALARNDGRGAFAWESSAMAPVSPSSAATSQVVAGDFDADGDVDLATVEAHPFAFATSFYGVYLRPLTNAGAAGFASPFAHSLGVDIAHRSVAVDLDQDGYADVVTALGYSNTVALARGSAAGLLAPATIASVSGLRDLDVGDFDGDGDVDIAVAGSFCGLLLNDGAGAFVLSTPFATPSAKRVSASDVDLDGDLDLWFDNQLSVRIGATWSFAGAAATGAVEGGYGATSFDFEGDGDVDTYVGSGFVHAANGPGSIASIAGPTLTNPACAFVDLDRDGDRDLVYIPATGGTAGLLPTGVPRLFHNRARQTSLDAPFRAGRATHVGLHGAPNGLYFLFASLGPANLAAAPYGTILIDPASTVLVSGGSLDANGFADAVGFLPAGFSAFAGLGIELQGVVDTVAGPRLTNARRAVVRSF
jgi:hypothetical protein